MTRLALLLALAPFALSACDEDDPAPDAAAQDAAAGDAAQPDVGAADATPPDAEPIPCLNPPPVGCLTDADCGGRFCCVRDDEANCLPSACTCNAAGVYECTDDCGSGNCLEGDACQR
ncbi:MAG: hypothetical protein KC549_11540 [Myxococcales bacterium]|nr:hypothetical protein [Myxococcales bacterium]MCB9544611.1 hypothetical protein [Myxococcales bacterium]